MKGRTMSLNQIKKAIMYVRVSSKEQEKEGLSIPAQIDYLEKYAEMNGLKIVKVFREVETAKKAGRKEFKKMVDFISESKDVKTIIAEKTDRLYRNITDWTTLDSDRLDIEIHLAKENTIISKSSNSNAKFMHGIKVLMAKNYIDNLSEEVKKGHDEKLKRGIWPGKAPVGYKNRLEDHTIVVDEAKAPIIKKAFELAMTGNYSLSRLKKELALMGLRGDRSGREFSKSQMAKILSNNFYYGEFYRAGKLYKASHRPIISKDVFEKVQYVQGFVKKPSKSKHDFAFRGPLVCKNCGCQITAEIKKKASGIKYTYYHCTNGKGICDKVTYIKEENLAEQFLEAFSKIEISSDIVEYTRDTLLSSHREEKEFREKQIVDLLARYKKLQSFIDNTYTDKVAGIIGDSDWERMTGIYKTEQMEIELKVASLREANTAYMIEGVKLMEIANSAAKLFPTMTIEQKRQMINLVLSNPVLDGSSLCYDYQKPFDMFVNVTEIKKWRERRDSNPRPSA